MIDDKDGLPAISVLTSLARDFAQQEIPRIAENVIEGLKQRDTATFSRRSPRGICETSSAGMRRRGPSIMTFT